VFSYNADARPAVLTAGWLISDRICMRPGTRWTTDRQHVEGGLVALMIATPGQLNCSHVWMARRGDQGFGQEVDVRWSRPVPRERRAVKIKRLSWPSGREGMFAVDAGSTQGVAETMREYKLTDKASTQVI